LLRALIAWSQGDRHVWSVVRVPNVDEEDLRRSHRERDRLVRERTAHINRIKGLLFGQGIRGINVKSKYKTLQIDKLVTGDGRPLPPRLANEITREIARLALIQEQIATLERERDQAPTPCKATEKKRLQLMSLNGIGPAIAAVMTREVYYRQFENRRQVAGFLGLATSPHDSGDRGCWHGHSAHLRKSHVTCEECQQGRSNREDSHLYPPFDGEEKQRQYSGTS
jgi:transposase